MNTPHNDYLWIASEAGLTGLGVYLWFLTAGLRCLLRMSRDAHPPARIAALTFGLSLLASLGDAFFNFPREQPQAAMFLYLLFGIAAGATAEERSKVEGRRSNDPIRTSGRGDDPVNRPGWWFALRHSGKGGRVRSVCRLLPCLLLVVSLTALELDRRRIGFDRHYLRAMSSAALPGEGQAVLAETRRALGYGAFRPHLFNLKGHALQGLGRYAEAGEAYRQVLVYTPHSWHAHNGLCAVAIQQGRLEEALAHGQAALSLCPTFPEAHNNLGSALARKGDLDAAIQEYRKAIRLKPDFPEARHNLNLVLKAKKDRTDAREAF